ncbi:MAG: hypothetical protein QF384_11985 [Alphaproteobacteria bacterium]|jgi:hypothetical protein|nr:hypothetical protein [Alphaproteobacteria bacterium]MDP6831320.1 hypothetical protein [Alphaproteobacteria bacterium]
MSQQTQNAETPVGMTPRQARRVEFSIIGLCVVALVLIFQPYSLTLFSIGAGLVVLGGLAFNLVPLCRPGVSVRALVKAGIIVLVILAVVIALAIGSAKLYAIYLTA